MYTYINHYAQPHQSYPNITTVIHSYEYNPTIDNSTIETSRNRAWVNSNSRLLHIKKCTDRPTVAAPKCQPSEDEPPDHYTGILFYFINGICGAPFGYQRAK